MKSYLAWPLTVQGPQSQVRAHVTFKYLGEDDFTIANLLEAIEGLMTRLDLSHAYWDPEIWCAEGEPDHHVMVLGGLDPALEISRKFLEPFRKDDYPFWRPHVTVPREVFLYLRDRRISPQDAIANVGCLMLFVDQNPVYMFGPKQ